MTNHDWKPGTLFLVFFGLLASSLLYADKDSSPLPPWYDQKMIDQAALGWGFEREEIKAIELLAWNNEIDVQGKRIDNALFWMHVHVREPRDFYQSKPDFWVLFSLSRYPQRDKAWYENPRIGSHGRPGIHFFEHPPRNADVYDFLANDWEFTSTKHFRLLDGEIRRKTWRQVIGEEPTKFHADEKRR